MKILITAFDPFGGDKVNPALEAVKKINTDLFDAEIVKLEIPTVFGKSIEKVAAAIEAEKPDVVLWIKKASRHAFRVWSDGFKEGESSSNTLQPDILALLDELQTLRSELSGHKSARMAYASEFPPNVDGEPDVGSINQNIRALKYASESLRSERTAWRVTAENAEAAVKQARIDALEEAKQACANLIGGASMFATLRECNLNNTAVRDCVDAIESLKGKTP